MDTSYHSFMKSLCISETEMLTGELGQHLGFTLNLLIKSPPLICWMFQSETGVCGDWTKDVNRLATRENVADDSSGKSLALWRQFNKDSTCFFKCVGGTRCTERTSLGLSCRCGGNVADCRTRTLPNDDWHRVLLCLCIGWKSLTTLELSLHPVPMCESVRPFVCLCVCVFEQKHNMSVTDVCFWIVERRAEWDKDMLLWNKTQIKPKRSALSITVTSSGPAASLHHYPNVRWPT